MNRFHRTAQICAAASIALGVAAMLGWLMEWRVLTSIRINYIPMAPNTALACIILGAALMALARPAFGRRTVRFVRLGASLVMLVGMLRLMEYLAGVDLGVDKWVLNVPGETLGLAPVGRMALFTAVICVLAAAALLLLTSRSKQPGLRDLASILALGVLASGFVFSLGYLYDVPLLYHETTIPMALNTALAFVFLGTGLISLPGPAAVPLQPFLGKSVRARLLRVFLPFAVSTVIIVSWLTLLVTQHAGPSYAPIMSALLAVIAIFAAAIACVRLASLVGESLERAEESLRKAHDEMEVRVVQRTQELTQAKELLEKQNRELQELTAHLEASSLSERKIHEALRKNRELLQAVLDNSTAVIYMKDTEGRYRLINHWYETLFHVTREEVIGKTDYHIFPKEMADAFRENDRKVLATGTPLQFEEAYPHPALPRLGGGVGGGVHTYISIKFPIRDADGSAYAVCGISTDITERKRAEKALRDSEALYQSLVENLPMNVFRKDLQGRFTFANQRFLSTVGKPRQAILGKTDFDFFPLHLAEKYRTDDVQVMQTRKPLEAVEAHVTPDGEKLYVQVMKTPVVDFAGAVLGTQGIFWDVTEHKRNEQRVAMQHAVTRVLAESQNLRQALPRVLQVICETLGWDWGAVWRVDPRAGVLYCCDVWHTAEMPCPEFEALSRRTAFARGIGLPGRVWAGRQPAWIHDVVKDSNFPRAPVAGKEGLHGAFGFPILLSNQVLGVIEFFSREIREPDTDLLQMMAVLGSQVGQFIERKAAEEALRHSNEQLKELATHLEQVASSERQAHEELKKAQSQLVQSEKLAALGQMVAGVAHEINNPLSFVINNVAVLQREVKALHDLVALYREADGILSQHRPELYRRIGEFAQSIDLGYLLSNLDELLVRSRDGLKRIHQIVKDLRDFARLDESDLQDADLNAGIESTLNIVRGRAKKKRVELLSDLDELPPVTCYAAKVNQVVLNLVANAIDACPDGGKVTVRTCTAKDGVEIHVLDTGSGIPAAIRDRIFDPFFTTKPPGEGTGLGLSISYAIIQDHGGRIDVQSPAGQGAHFTVWLPLKPVAATRAAR